MGKIVNINWYNKIKGDINNGIEIDEIISFVGSIKALIVLLSDKNIPFKVYNLGTGVKRITTNTNKCPCCGKNL